MTTSLILKSQADQVFQIINNLAMNPQDFSWETTNSGMTKDLLVSKLVHTKTKYYFRFDLYNSNHYCVYSPGETKQTDTQFPGSWDLQINYLIKWITYLSREVESSDLWGQIEKKSLLAKGVSEYDNNLMFTPVEFVSIQTSLREIKEFIISTKSFTETEIKFLETKITYLEESSKRLGRKDWISILIGVLTNIIIGLAFSPDTAKELFKISTQAFNWLIVNSFVLPK